MLAYLAKLISAPKRKVRVRYGRLRGIENVQETDDQEFGREHFEIDLDLKRKKKVSN